MLAGSPLRLARRERLGAARRTLGFILSGRPLWSASVLQRASYRETRRWAAKSESDVRWRIETRCAPVSRDAARCPYLLVLALSCPSLALHSPFR
jgi:hypothetical protein